jgi:hypothetical protein
MSLQLPVRAQGYDRDGSAWVEMTTSTDASLGGAGVKLQHPVRVGQVLHLALPLPRRFRVNDAFSPSYRVYAVVRAVHPDGRAGVRFLGPDAPPGTATAGDRRKSQRKRGVFFLVLRGIMPSGDLDERLAEATVAEDLGEGGACVRTSLVLSVGDIVWLAEAAGPFRTRAEVRNVTPGKDGVVRLNLMFLDGAPPERLFGTVPR